MMPEMGEIYELKLILRWIIATQEKEMYIVFIDRGQGKMMKYCN